MSKRRIDRRTFAQLTTMAIGASMLPSVPVWAQTSSGKKRNVVIGHTGITWPGRPFTGRRGGGAPAAQQPAAGAPAPAAPAAAAAEGRRGGGPPPPPDPAMSETIFKDVSELGFAGLELFDWQIVGLESQGLLSQFVAKYKLPLVSSYTSVQLTDPARRAETIAAAVNVGQHHEEVRRQNHRDWSERSRRRRQLQLQRAQTEHRHDAERAGQGDHRHRSHRRAAPAHRYGRRDARRNVRDDGGSGHPRM